MTYEEIERCCELFPEAKEAWLALGKPKLDFTGGRDPSAFDETKLRNISMGIHCIIAYHEKLKGI